MINKKIRRAARTVVLDGNSGKIAVLEVKDGDYHKIPGGEIEEGENPEAAARREAREEAACDVEIIARLDESQFETPEFPDLINHSVCFLAKKTRDLLATNFTNEEKDNNFHLIWRTFEEAAELFANVRSKKPDEIAMNNRDFKFIEQARKRLKC